MSRHYVTRHQCLQSPPPLFAIFPVSATPATGATGKQSVTGRQAPSGHKAGMDGSRTHLPLLRAGTTVLKTAATTR